MKKLRTLIYALVPVLLIIFVIHADAASIYFSPSSGSYTVGQQLRVRVLAENVERAMNAAAAYISFSKESLELISISRSTSIIDFWAQGPTFSNQSGEASFEGVTFDGYQGSSGELVTLVFRAESPGEATLRFISGNILADDGFGTEIPSSLGQASFSIRVALPIELPAAPVISSPTHGSEGLWYSHNDPTFTWVLPLEVIDVDVVLSRDGTATFDGLEDGRGRIDRFELRDVAEGTHYIHVIFRTESGWGNVGTFRFNVDTESPEFLTIQEVYRSARDDRRGEFTFTARDKTSGIDHYRVTIDERYFEEWVDDGSHMYRTPPLDIGTHTLGVEVFDKAGNTLKKELVFRIQYPFLLMFLIGAAIIVFLLTLLLVVAFRRHSLMKKVYKTTSDVKGIESHLRDIKRKKERLQAEEKLLRRLEHDLSEVEKQLEQDRQDIKEQLGKK